MSTTTRPSYGQPALIGGLVMGVLSALPLINVGNACCCLWVIGGGLVAAYIFQQNQTEPMTPSDGALVGLLAGLTGAAVQLVVSIPLDMIVGPMQREMVRRILDMSGNMPSNWRDILERADQGSNRAAWFIVGHIAGFVFWLFVGAIFSTLGGLIGAAIFKKNPPPGTIDVTPTGPAM